MFHGYLFILTITENKLYKNIKPNTNLLRGT